MVALQADEGDAPPKPKARMLLDALAGSIAGAISRVCIGPLDVIKIRFQVQLEPIAEHGASGIIAGVKPRVPSLSKYTGLKQALTTIVREEGIQVSAENCLPKVSGVVHGPPHAGLPVAAISWCAHLTFHLAGIMAGYNPRPAAHCAIHGSTVCGPAPVQRSGCSARPDRCELAENQGLSYVSDCVAHSLADLYLISDHQITCLQAAGCKQLNKRSSDAVFINKETCSNACFKDAGKTRPAIDAGCSALLHINCM